MLWTMYWRVQGFPELQHLSPEDRRRIIRECFGPAGEVRWVIRLVVMGTFCGISAAMLIANLAGIRAGNEIWLVAPMVLAAIAIVYQLRLIQVRGQLLMYLERVARKQRLPMCLGCGYDLTGLTSGTCPECGLRIAAEAEKKN